MSTHQPFMEQNHGVMGAGPAHQSMEHTPLGSQSRGMIVQQRNGWCDCRTGYAVQPFVDGMPARNSDLPPPTVSVWQMGSCCTRVCCGYFPEYRVFAGDVNIQQMENEMSVPGHMYTQSKPCCVCCPQMITTDATGGVVGRTVRQCTLCLPSYAVEGRSGETRYTLAPDSVCCCFPKIECQKGSKCCVVPYYINDPRTGDHVQNNANIVHVWTGMRRECCTPNAAMAISYPPQATADDKAVLMGSSLLILLVSRQEAADGEGSNNF